MQTYLVETYVSARKPSDVGDSAERAAAAAAELTCDGMRVSYLDAIFIPDDDTCFFLFEAASEDAVAVASERALLRHHRIVAVALADLPEGPGA